MRISFTFVRAKDLRTSLLITRPRIFYSPVHRGYIRKVSVHLVQEYFPHDCSTYSISCREQKKSNLMKKYQNETATRQRRDSVTGSNAIARKINTMLLLPTHRACRRAAANSVVVSNPLDTLYILCRRHHCHFVVFVIIFLRRRLRPCCRFLGPVADHPPPPLLSPIPWTRRLFLVPHQRLCRCH